MLIPRYKKPVPFGKCYFFNETIFNPNPHVTKKTIAMKGEMSSPIFLSLTLCVIHGRHRFNNLNIGVHTFPGKTTRHQSAAETEPAVTNQTNIAVKQTPKMTSQPDILVQPPKKWQTMCHSSRPFCTRHIPGFGLVGRTPGPSKMLSRRDGLLGCQARVRRAPLYACGWIRLLMLVHA